MLNWIEVSTIKKSKTGIEWPLVSKEILKKHFKNKAGLYQLIYNGDVIKNGIFGEGKTKNINIRISAYRSISKSLDKIRNGILAKNGSYLTVDTLEKRLNVGDEVTMIACVVSDDKMDEFGVIWKVDLYKMEEDLKSKHKNTIWLS
jgi:hypothetical protein